jgi:hypothetical protein
MRLMLVRVLAIVTPSGQEADGPLIGWLFEVEHAIAACQIARIRSP